MGIKLASAPVLGLQAVREAMTRLETTASQRAIGGSSLNGPWKMFVASRASLTAAAPHPCYDLGLDALVAGRGLAAAELTSWRYLLEDRNRTIAFAEVAPPDAGGQVEFRSFNAGRFGPATRRAIAAAETLDFVRNGDFELRLLRVPAIYVLALWLWSEVEDDGLVPIDPAPSPIVAGRAYREQEFLDALRPMASDRTSFRE